MSFRIIILFFVLLAIAFILGTFQASLQQTKTLVELAVAPQLTYNHTLDMAPVSTTNTTTSPITTTAPVQINACDTMETLHVNQTLSCSSFLMHLDAMGMINSQGAVSPAITLYFNGKEIGPYLPAPKSYLGPFNYGGGTYYVIIGQTFAGLYDKWAEISIAFISNATTSTTTVTSTSTTINPLGPGVKYWAVLIDTQVIPNSSDSILLKDELIEKGWQADHIKLILGKNATYDNFTAALDWLGQNSGPNDTVLITTASHGESMGIQLADGFFTYLDFAARLNKINYSGLGIIISACKSNNAIQYLKKQNRVILLAPSYLGAVIRPLEGFGDVIGNNDNWVSLEEVYNFIKTNNSWPLQDDYPGGKLDLVFLNGSLRYLDQYNMRNDPLSLSVDGNSWLAQSFKPNYSILNKVMLDFDRQSDGVGPLTVSIRKNLSGSDLAVVTLPQGSFLYTQNYSISRIHEFNFSDIAVVPGETYYIVIRAPSAVWEGVNWKSAYFFTYDRNSYSNGKVFASYNSGTSWLPLEQVPSYANAYPPFTAGDRADLFFATFGEPTATTTSTTSTTTSTSTSSIQTTVPANYGSYTIDYQPGWNLFSLPLAYVSSSSSSCQGTALSPIWYWQNGAYVKINYLYGERGYWIMSSTSCSVTFYGPRITSTDLPTLTAGWNMIGTLNYSTPLSNIVGNCNVIGGPFGYSTSLNSYYNATVLKPGLGYFIEVKSVCNLGSFAPPPPP